jgi:hypothetical protein
MQFWKMTLKEIIVNRPTMRMNNYFILCLLILSNYAFGQASVPIVNKVTIEMDLLRGIRYDRIFAYNINYDSVKQIKTRQQVEITRIDDYKLTKPYACSKRLLSDSLEEELVNMLSDTSSFGRNYADCFEPRLVFQFLNQKKEEFRIVVCEECGYLISTKPLPASHEKYYDNSFIDGNGKPVIYRRYLKGFSVKGGNRITNVCKSLGMLYYKNKGEQ